MRQISGVNICKEVTCMTNYREVLRLRAADRHPEIYPCIFITQI